VRASDEIIQLANQFAIPVSTTLQGLSSFPANHPLHTGFGFGPSAVPSARNAFADCDCLIAIGTRFGEIATGSYGVTVPENLIHIDINPDVFSRNYPAAVSIEGDSKVVLKQLLAELSDEKTRNSDQLSQQIAADKKAYREEWYQHDNNERVNPARFFDQLRINMDDDATLVVDDGNHTFLTAELMPVHFAKGMISPTDFNCMGYAVPASIGAKLVRKDKQVVTIVGDGAFLMTAMELATATKNNLSPIICIFNDGELSQIGQAQERPYNRKTCSDIATVKFEGVAMATGCEYVHIKNNDELKSALDKAFAFSAENKAVIVDVNIDYSKPTAFTDGVVKTNIARLPFDTKVRMIGRAIYRKITG